MTPHPGNARLPEPLRQWPHLLQGSEAGYNLDYIKIYRDHRCKRHWKGGKDFAVDVKGKCPEGKIPALLLTDRLTSEIDQFTIDTDSEHITVICVDALAEMGGALMSYLAKVTGTDPEDYDNLKLNRQLTTDDIRAWDHPHKVRELLKIVKENASNEDASEHITQEFDDEIYESLGQLLSASPNVIHALSAAASESLASRMEKVKQEADEFDRMLCDEENGETQCQEWLQNHPWVFGLEYVRVRPKQETARGEIDFLLERYDGFHDLLELKSPQHMIIKEVRNRKDVTPSPTHYKLGPALSNALAQAHSYKVRLKRDEQYMEEEFQIKKAGSPKVIVVVGMKSKLTDHSVKILEEFNRSLHGVEIIPFDLVAKRARMLVENAERYLLGMQDQESPPAESESNDQSSA